MIVTDVRHKLLIFTQETGISKQEISKELGYHYNHFSAIMSGKYGLSDRFYGEVEKLFRRTGYIKALDNKGRL
ncbi:hypothetical protein [Clostridium tyrobutyricum]|uniref:hypothetical protein n=1 Tax=Clostridium tyrobutyricum TaxID=1519 RepID=UPI001C381DAE|nr:hypothetical protein [Clostridium tyrobutyricum]MBV4429080.1 hypothetical protein [Clostridium tyrobutyricum]MBV4444157.1 hypothetical protein [Clostridium tyrobutyricum]